MSVGDTFIPSLPFWMENAIQAHKYNVYYWETNKNREVEAQIAAYLYSVQHGSYLQEFAWEVLQEHHQAATQPSVHRIPKT